MCSEDLKKKKRKKFIISDKIMVSDTWIDKIARGTKKQLF